MEAARFQERDVTTAGRVKPVIGYNQPSGGYGLNYDYGLYSLLHATLLLLLPLFFLGYLARSKNADEILVTFTFLNLAF